MKNKKKLKYGQIPLERERERERQEQRDRGKRGCAIISQWVELFQNKKKNKQKIKEKKKI